MASVAAERINQMINPERSIEQAMTDYRRLGRSVVSSEKAIDYIQSPEELPFEKPDEQ